MASEIFKTLVDQKIEAFRSSFTDTSVSLFTDEGKLFHPAEFGAYRENALSDLLRSFTPNTYDLSNGFIITPDNKVSTQCDILVVNRNSVTLFNKDIKFHPFEQVAGIIEVKSNLNRQQFEKALRKLAKNKMLFESRYNPSKSDFADETLPLSCLVCKQMAVDFKKDSEELFERIYTDIPRRFWHNIILSLDGCTIDYNLTPSDLEAMGLKAKPGSVCGWYNSELTVDRIKLYRNAKIKITNYEPDELTKQVRGFLAVYGEYLPRLKLEPLDILKYLDCATELIK